MQRSTRTVLAFSLVVPLAAAAFGGWATITVENLPETLPVSAPTNITFSVRQHGVRLLTGLEPTVELASGKRELTARAVATNKAGYYTATVTPPAAGDWTITIRSGFGRSNVELLPIAAVTSGTRPTPLALQERGRHLFVAKGCASCHEHARVKGSGETEVGPDLSTPRLQPEYVAKFLHDPSIKKDWRGAARMPDLELQGPEIRALVAFLNQQPAGVTAAR